MQGVFLTRGQWEQIRDLALRALGPAVAEKVEPDVEVGVLRGRVTDDVIVPEWHPLFPWAEGEGIELSV